MVEILSKGFYTTIQDFGRIGHQHHGVPISGAMDKRAAKLANALIGNIEDAAVMEITMSGPKLRFGADTAIAITGACMGASLNRESIPNNRFVEIKKGDILSFGKLNLGFRCYVAIIGGFQTEMVLGSRSMYHGVTAHSNIIKGDILKIGRGKGILKQKQFSGLKVNDGYLKSSKLNVYKGPEFECLTKSQKEVLFSKTFMVSKKNSRMAYQLEETFQNNLKPIITSLVLPGSVQLTPSGKLIVLMRDCQTTGGYPRVLQLSEMAINSLSQKFTGDSLYFVLKNRL